MPFLTPQDQGVSPQTLNQPAWAVQLVEAFWFETQGYALSDRLFVKVPQLGAHRDKLLDHIVDRVWSSTPGVIPLSTKDLFVRFLD